MNPSCVHAAWSQLYNNRNSSNDPPLFFGQTGKTILLWFIIIFRDGNLDSIKADSPRSSSASTLSDEPELPARSVSLPPGHPGYMGSPDQPFLPRRSNSVSYPSPVLIANNVERMLHITQHSIHVKPRNFSPNSSHPSNEGSSSSSLKDSDSMDGSPLPASIVSSEEQQMTTVSQIRPSSLSSAKLKPTAMPAH